MSNVISDRFVMVVNKLIKDNKVRSARQLCISLDYLPQSYTEVVNGRRDVTMEVLRKFIELYNVNPIFLFLGSGAIFLDDDAPYSFKTLTLVTDKENEERIIHVPMPAQAGYADSFNQLEMIKDLPTYTLPDITYQTGTFRSFDVKGDSMYPTIEESDVLICSYIEPNLWESSIRDHHVYVVVTEGDVVVKRVTNNLRKHKHLEMHSDNETFNMYRLFGNEIKEVWYVKAKLSKFKHMESKTAVSISKQDMEDMFRSMQEEMQRIVNPSH